MISFSVRNFNSTNTTIILQRCRYDTVLHEIWITSEASNLEMYFGDEIMFQLTFSYTFYIPFFIRSDVLNIKMTEMVTQKLLTWTFYVHSTTIDYHTLLSYSLLCRNTYLLFPVTYSNGTIYLIIRICFSRFTWCFYCKYKTIYIKPSLFYYTMFMTRF